MLIDIDFVQCYTVTIQFKLIVAHGNPVRHITLNWSTKEPINVSWSSASTRTADNTASKVILFYLRKRIRVWEMWILLSSCVCYVRDHQKRSLPLPHSLHLYHQYLHFYSCFYSYPLLIAHCPYHLSHHDSLSLVKPWTWLPHIQSLSYYHLILISHFYLSLSFDAVVV